MEPYAQILVFAQADPEGWFTVPFWVVGLVVGAMVTVGLLYFIQNGPPE